MLIWIIYRLRRIIFGTVFYFFLWLINSNCCSVYTNNTRGWSAKSYCCWSFIFFWESKLINTCSIVRVTDLCIKQRRRVCCKDERMENTYLVTVTSTTWQPVTFVWTSIDSIYIQLILKVNWINSSFFEFIPGCKLIHLKLPSQFSRFECSLRLARDGKIGVLINLCISFQYRSSKFSFICRKLIFV
jgi:hypothetical protein